MLEVVLTRNMDRLSQYKVKVSVHISAVIDTTFKRVLADQ